MSALEHALVIPAEFTVSQGDDERRRAFEDAVAWCATQTDDRLWWLRTKIALRIGWGSFYAEHLYRTSPRENLVFLMIVAANLRAVREHFEREALAQRRPAALIREARPC